MIGAIRRKQMMSELFNTFDTLVEVYSNVDFDYSDNNIVMVFLCRGSMDLARLFNEMLKIYEGHVSTYYTNNPTDIILQGRKIIWRKGAWYV